jgi:hypothetical protein
MAIKYAKMAIKTYQKAPKLSIPGSSKRHQNGKFGKKIHVPSGNSAHKIRDSGKINCGASLKAKTTQAGGKLCVLDSVTGLGEISLFA